MKNSLTPATPSAAEIEHRIRSYLGNGGLFNPELMEHEKVRDLIMDIGRFLQDCKAHTAAAVESQRVKDREVLNQGQRTIATLLCERDAAQSRIAALERELAEEKRLGTSWLHRSYDAAHKAEAAERQLAEAQRELAAEKLNAHQSYANAQAADNWCAEAGDLRSKLEAAEQLAAQRAGECDKLRESLNAAKVVSEEDDDIKASMAEELQSLRAQLTQEQEAHSKTSVGYAGLLMERDQLTEDLEALNERYNKLANSQQRAECADRLAEALNAVVGDMCDLQLEYHEANPPHENSRPDLARGVRALRAYAATTPKAETHL